MELLEKFGTKVNDKISAIKIDNYKKKDVFILNQKMVEYESFIVPMIERIEDKIETQIIETIIWSANNNSFYQIKDVTKINAEYIIADNSVKEKIGKSNNNFIFCNLYDVVNKYKLLKFSNRDFGISILNRNNIIIPYNIDKIGICCINDEDFVFTLI